MTEPNGNNEKFCPLLLLGIGRLETLHDRMSRPFTSEVNLAGAFCFGDRCAWWAEEYSACALISIAATLDLFLGRTEKGKKL